MMVCSCTDSNCNKCKCGKANVYCTAECHQNKPWEQTECMNDEFGVQVKAMKIKDIRTAVIANGLSPIGDPGELKKRLADFLRQRKGVEIKKSEVGKGKGESGGDGVDMEALLDAVIVNEGNNTFILSLSGKEVSKLSGKADLRKAYLLLSTKVHPDKNAGSKDAVQAFQVVLSAYENLVNPPEEDEEEMPSAKRQKKERFTRSNHGCLKTKVVCPQCKYVWGDASLGVEDAAYNFLMMGIKKYICGRCCCQFGCMTALHYCPHCKKIFDYDSDDYHRKIICGNKKCKEEFGFWMFKVSERREQEVRIEVKKEFEEERKKLAQKKRRAVRADRRVDTGVTNDEQRLQEQLLIIGLRDNCPRCGWEVPRGEGTEEAKQHLEACNDKKSIEKYQKVLAKKRKEEEMEKNAKENQYEVMALKRWEINGRQVGQLWMLSESNIKKQCEQFALSTDGAKHEMISRLSKYLRSKERLMITDGKTNQSSEAVYDTCSIENADAEDLPDNIETLDREELQDICASYNIKFNPKKDVKASLLNKFQSSRSKGRDVLLICDENDESSLGDESEEEYNVDV